MARKKPTPKIQTKDINRGREYKRDDNVKNISVEIMDMDSAIMYYFDKVIQPTVEESGEQVKVPVLYANPERWNSIRKTGGELFSFIKRICYGIWNKQGNMKINYP